MHNNSFLDKLKSLPQSISFQESIDYIAQNYRYTPSRFSNGAGEDQVVNEAGTNEGSCKILAFALLENLSDEQTLNCFGDYYRRDVLEHPNGDDHANIRTFMRHGLGGLHFEQIALAKNTD